MLSPRSFLVTRQNQLHSPNSASSRRPSSPSPSSRSRSSSPLSSSPTTSSPKDDYSVRITAEDLTNAIGFAMPLRRNSGSGAAVTSTTPALSPAKPTTALTRPTTPTSPVQIPVKQKHHHSTSHLPKQRRLHADSRRPRASSKHDADSIPASVANLLAVTSIPPLKGTRSVKTRKSPYDNRMTVESIIEHTLDAEKEFSFTLGGEGRSPLQVLLGPPDDFDSDVVSISEGTMGSPFSIRTISVESMPSLVDSYATGTTSPGDSPQTPPRGRKMRPTRRTMTPVSSPPGEREQHPLSMPSPSVEELDFRVFEDKPTSQEKPAEPRSAFRPLRSAFKSNLTASLRALRNAAKSFSNMNLTSIPPEDFLTRSLLTLDPRIPYTDERRPPPLEQEPSAELRRYLNPTTTTHVSSPNGPAHSPTRTAFTASIQMQTYKVHRSRGSHSPTRPQTPAFASMPTSEPDQPTEHPLPGPRQRELRENSDFIRIAVMEMAMRRKGKLDDRKPGRARLALPPRKTSAKPYEIGADGVPARWVPVAG